MIVLVLPFEKERKEKKKENMHAILSYPGVCVCVYNYITFL